VRNGVEVSYPGYFDTIPHGMMLAAYFAIGEFEIRLLYAYGSAQVGFTPFVTKFNITSVHTHSEAFFAEESFNINIIINRILLLRDSSSLHSSE